MLGAGWLAGWLADGPTPRRRGFRSIGAEQSATQSSRVRSDVGHRLTAAVELLHAKYAIQRSYYGIHQLPADQSNRITPAAAAAAAAADVDCEDNTVPIVRLLN